MMQYIDKSALVAEIYKLKKSHDNWSCMGKSFHRDYETLLSFIDTLEVKEVDLEKEYKDFVEEDPVYNKLVNGIVGKAIAKHFFELGMVAGNKGQKGEKV